MNVKMNRLFQIVQILLYRLIVQCLIIGIAIGDHGHAAAAAYADWDTIHVNVL